MQAATVIVAWYIRDRIQRKRRKQRKAFKRGLAQRAREAIRERESGRGMSKGERVRRWVMSVPTGEENASQAGSAAARRSPELPADQEEREFDIDRERGEDKDSQLYNVADNLIKSHLARIDVPLLGVLSFDPESESSDSEESDYELMDYEDEPELGEDPGEEEEEDDDDEEEEEEEEYDDEDDAEDDDGYNDYDDYYEDQRRGRGAGRDGKADETASKAAQIGTTKGSRKRSRSSVS